MGLRPGQSTQHTLDSDDISCMKGKGQISSAKSTLVCRVIEIGIKRFNAGQCPPPATYIAIEMLAAEAEGSDAAVILGRITI